MDDCIDTAHSLTQEGRVLETLARRKSKICLHHTQIVSSSPALLFIEENQAEQEEAVCFHFLLNALVDIDMSQVLLLLEGFIVLNPIGFLTDERNFLEFVNLEPNIISLIGLDDWKKLPEFPKGPK
jgi:hypothetical protein